MPSTAGAQPGYNVGTGVTSGQSTTGATHARTTHLNTSRSEIRVAQEKLRDDGLYKGQINGRLTSQTRHAIAQFQKQNGLRVTSSFDRETRDSLIGGGSMGQGSTAPPTHRMSPSHAGSSSYQPK